jgi:hypothetical protein
VTIGDAPFEHLLFELVLSFSGSHDRADQRQQPLVVGTRTVAPSPWGRLLALLDQI